MRAHSAHREVYPLRAACQMSRRVHVFVMLTRQVRSMRLANGNKYSWYITLPSCENLQLQLQSMLFNSGFQEQAHQAHHSCPFAAYVFLAVVASAPLVVSDNAFRACQAAAHRYLLRSDCNRTPRTGCCARSGKCKPHLSRERADTKVSAPRCTRAGREHRRLASLS